MLSKLFKIAVAVPLLAIGLNDTHQKTSNAAYETTPAITQPVDGALEVGSLPDEEVLAADTQVDVEVAQAEETISADSHVLYGDNGFVTLVIELRVPKSELVKSKSLDLELDAGQTYASLTPQTEDQPYDEHPAVTQQRQQASQYVAVGSCASGSCALGSNYGYSGLGSGGALQGRPVARAVTAPVRIPARLVGNRRERARANGRWYLGKRLGF